MSSFYQLEFEKPLVEVERRLESLEARLAKLRVAPSTDAPPVPPTVAYESGTALATEPDDADELGADPESIARDIDLLRARHREMLEHLYSNLGAWDTVRVARHPKRPQTRDYI